MASLYSSTVPYEYEQTPVIMLEWQKSFPLPSLVHNKSGICHDGHFASSTEFS